MTLTESLADAKARRAVIIDRISMGQSEDIVRKAGMLRNALVCLVVGLVIIGISIRVRDNGI